MASFSEHSRQLAQTPLLGRDYEIEALDALLASVRDRGGALVLTGEPGIGKSVLLDHAIERAGAQGMRVLMASGVESEAHLPFAGLNQMLRPVLDQAQQLARLQREALLAAMGMADARSPELFLIGVAVLNLLANVAEQAPLLLVADDLQWLDDASVEVLGFLARRLESDPIALLVARRAATESPLDQAGLPETHIGPLDESAAKTLLEMHAAGLTPAVRQRLLEDSVGNPLALVQLALSAGRIGEEQVVPDWLPLTKRLERAFAARMVELPLATKELLLVAALNDSRGLDESLRAGSIVAARELGVADLAPAVSARLIEANEFSIRFHHPLVRSALHQGASLSQRHAAHRALAEVLAGDPDRQVWHRAASALGEDEELARALQSAGDRAQQRGDLATAGAALERAGQLSVGSYHRAARLLKAAELATELGDRAAVLRLVRQAEGLELAPLEQGRLAWIREMSEPGLPGDPAAVQVLIEASDRVAAQGDSSLALKLLRAAAMSGFWADRGPQTRDRLLAAADRLPLSTREPMLLSIFAYAAPIERGAVVVEQAARATPDRRDPERMDLMGNAAATVGAFDLSIGFMTAAVDTMREQGRLVRLAQALVVKAWSEIHLGRWGAAVADAEEARRLADETAQPIWGAGADVGLAVLAGLRGDEDDAEAFAAAGERVGLTFGANAVLAVTQLARGLTSLGAGRYDDAYEKLRHMFDPTDPAHHHMESTWAIGNLAEAAVHSGRTDEARAVMHRLEPIADQTPSPWLHLALRHARAVLADDDHAEDLFHTGLAADLSRWPFDRARLQLAQGMWLRRHRRVTESRTPLRAARDAFDALRAIPWGERARQELRATGEPSRRRTPKATDELTPQELRIAEMAAQGLSNRDIGEMVYLSHRTVSSHLYRIFPKLGISSRTELSAALGDAVAGAR